MKLARPDIRHPKIVLAGCPALPEGDGDDAQLVDALVSVASTPAGCHGMTRRRCAQTSSSFGRRGTTSTGSTNSSTGAPASPICSTHPPSSRGTPTSATSPTWPTPGCQPCRVSSSRPGERVRVPEGGGGGEAVRSVRDRWVRNALSTPKPLGSTPRRSTMRAARSGPALRLQGRGRGDGARVPQRRAVARVHQGPDAAACRSASGIRPLRHLCRGVAAALPTPISSCGTWATRRSTRQPRT